MTIQKIHESVQAMIEDSPLAWDDRMQSVFEDIDAYEEWRVEKHYYLYLNALVHITQPKTILELGTNEGGSALFMLLALPEEGHITTVDKNVLAPAALRNLQDDRLRVVYGDVLDEAVYATLGLDPIDLLFIDTEHTYEQVSQEWRVYQEYMALGGIVVMDDIFLNAGMIKFWKEIEGQYPSVASHQDYHWSGFGVFEYDEDRVLL